MRDLVYKGAESFTLGAEVAGCDFRIEIGNKGDELTITHERLSQMSPDWQSIYWTEGLSTPANFLNSFATVLIRNPFYEDKTFGYMQAFALPDVISLQAVCNQLLTSGNLDPNKSDIESNSFYSEINAIKTVISALSNVLFFDLIPSAMRDESYPETQLRNTGANLAGVLHTLWQQPDQQAHILAFIQSLPEQDIKELKFYTDHRGRVELALIETFGHQDQEQSIELLSDGTLRVLAIAAALLSAPEGSTVVIEEVDNGVHPSRAKQLLTTMREHAERRNLRLLLSTHNPALMDALPDEALGDVVFCYRDPTDGDSRLVRLSDLDDYMGLVMQGSLGQLVTRGIVDRFVKNPVTPEEKKQKALDWLAMMQGDDE